MKMYRMGIGMPRLGPYDPEAEPRKESRRRRLGWGNGSFSIANTSQTSGRVIFGGCLEGPVEACWGKEGKKKKEREKQKQMAEKKKKKAALEAAGCCGQALQHLSAARRALPPRRALGAGHGGQDLESKTEGSGGRGQEPGGGCRAQGWYSTPRPGLTRFYQAEKGGRSIRTFCLSKRCIRQVGALRTKAVGNCFAQNILRNSGSELRPSIQTCTHQLAGRGWGGQREWGEFMLERGRGNVSQQHAAGKGTGVRTVLPGGWHAAMGRGGGCAGASGLHFKLVPILIIILCP